MVGAAKGVDVIVNGLNPPAYHNWANIIPDITRQVIAAAKANGATVILPGNIYNYGDQPGTLDENTRWKAHTRKGQIRIEMEKAYQTAAVQTIVLRAGNFIDPAGNGDIMSMLVTRELGKGKVTAAGDPDTLQAYAYVPDWARAAVLLAEMRENLALYEDIPFPGHAFTTTELRDHLARKLNRDLKINKFPWWMMTMLSPFWELARELREMRYLFAMSYQISGEKFARLVPEFRATDLATVMEAGLEPDIKPNEPMRPSRHPFIADQSA